MLDQEAVLDALYNREREPDTKYVSSIRGNDASSGINSTEDSSVPKDVKKNSFYMLTFNLRYKMNKNKKIFEMYENMDQDDAVEVTSKKSKVKTVQLEIFKEKIEDLQKRFEIVLISFLNFAVKDVFFFCKLYLMLIEIILQVLR